MDSDNLTDSSYIIEEDTDNSVPQTEDKPIKENFHTIIECGFLKNQRRVYKIYSELFEKEIDVFFAKSDSSRTPLFRARDLSNKLGCKTNKIGMYLFRNQDSLTGVYCAVDYAYKRPKSSGLLPRSYFVTEKTARWLEEKYRNDQRMKTKSTRKSESSKKSRDSQSAKPKKLSKKNHLPASQSLHEGKTNEPDQEDFQAENLKQTPDFVQNLASSSCSQSDSFSPCVVGPENNSNELPASTVTNLTSAQTQPNVVNYDSGVFIPSPPVMPNYQIHYLPTISRIPAMPPQFHFNHHLQPMTYYNPSEANVCSCPQCYQAGHPQHYGHSMVLPATHQTVQMNPEPESMEQQAFSNYVQIVYTSNDPRCHPQFPYP